MIVEHVAFFIGAIAFFIGLYLIIPKGEAF
jgi:hypothetical protein